MSNIKGYKTLSSACGFDPVIVSEKEYDFEGVTRKRLIVSRTKGKVMFVVIQYENGVYSSAVKMP